MLASQVLDVALKRLQQPKATGAWSRGWPSNRFQHASVLFEGPMFCPGAGAGAVGVLAGQPLDVVRVRLQQPHSAMPGALASLRAIVRAEGPGALFKGSFFPLTTIALQARPAVRCLLAQWWAGPLWHIWPHE